MTLDDNLAQFQDAAWRHIASLPDTDAVTNEDLAGWAAVARSAGPLLETLDRADLADQLRSSAASLPARPVAGVAPAPDLATMATELRNVAEQLPEDQAMRQQVSDVVAVAIQSTARTTAATAAEARNPQVRTAASQLETVAATARTSVRDPHAGSVPTARSTQIPDRGPAQRAVQARTDRRHERSTPVPRTEGPTRGI